MACIGPHSVDDMENIKSLDDIKGSPELHSKKPLLKHLQNLVTPYYAASWKEIGLQLGIAQGILQTIETNFQTDAKRCCTEMFTEWLDTDVTTSWGKLIQVVYSPAVKEIINTFNKSPYIGKESIESGAVEELENKLKKQHIVKRYRSSQDDWFSLPEHFTSVALIHQKKHKTKREIIEFANMHLKDNFTESGKITTDIAEIFKLLECNDNPYTLLIEGAPGIGKTVLSKEIVFQWAEGSMLKNEKLVFLIYLRDPKVKTLNNFESFINYISYSQVSKDIEQYICKKSGKDICLVFDGYDEYPEELRNNSFLSNVINHEVIELQLCNTVITSRPSASACLHNIVDLRVEILGFTTEHRKSYIMHALKDNPDAIQDLLEYLESSYSVDAYCHIPLSMAILVFLFKESDYDKNQLPTTQTEINYKFICITIRRFIKKSQQQSVSITKFSEVPATHRNILLEISKLAFTTLKDDKIVFSASEIKHFCPSLLEDPKDWNGLDLLNTVQYFSLEENKDELSFNFLHFSVQELLAAHHISLMSTGQQIKLLKETFWNSRYFNTWIMYVALTKDQPFAFKHFLSGNKLKIFTRFSEWRSGNSYAKVSKKMKEDKIKCLYLFQCFTEAGKDEMCQYVGNFLQDGTIDLSGQALSAVDLYTLSLFLARGVHRRWKLLDLSNCYLDDENLERFYKSYASLTKSTVFIDTVNLSSNAFTQASASQIANLVLNFNVQNLVFASNEIQDIGIDKETFVAFVEHPNLTQFRLIEIQDGNQVNVLLYKNGFKKSFASELFMSYCTVKAYKDLLYSYIGNNNSLFEKLVNTDSPSIFKTILHSLINKLMTFIFTNFKLHVKTIDTKEINSVIKSLACNVPLAVSKGDDCLPLHLYNISKSINDKNGNFDSLGILFFSGQFSNREINSVFHSFLAKDNVNQICLKGIVLNELYDHFVDNSLKCSSLNSLQLVNCYAHEITATNAVVDVLSQVINLASLKHLNLSACRMKTDQMKTSLEALKQIVSLKTIAISDNYISKEVVNILACVITSNRELQSAELSNCSLQEATVVSITEALETCEGLQSLDLSNNGISSNVVHNVANLIGKCQSIQDLKLNNCQLDYAGIQKIFEAMIEKKCLNFIDISNNSLSDQNTMLIASIIINNNNLSKLNFANCKLQGARCQQLLQAMAKITSLIHLDLSNNLLTDILMDSFAPIMHQNINLEYLNISGCCDKAEDFEKITHSLVTLKSLTHLDLSCNVINITSANNVAIIITNNTFLENLNLSKCEVRKSAFLKILSALQNNQYLKHLYFTSNSVGYEEAAGIAMVFTNNQFLENVDLSNCNLLTEKEMKVILSSLRNHTSLKHFDISSNTITNHVVNDIVDVIDSNTQLTHLNISDTKITEYGILKIFKTIQKIHSLKCIKLCNVTISDQAAQAISEAISVNCMVDELLFSNNDFHETGMSFLFDVLKEACVLKWLTLASNDVISDVEITEVIFKNCITHLNLSNCDLQHSSFSLILNTLTLQAPILQHIDLSGNNLSGTAEAMAHLISVSYYLQHVNLANTSMQDEEVMIIIKAMQDIDSLHCVNLISFDINDESALEVQKTIDKNPALIYFKISKLCFQKFKVIKTAFGKSIFTILTNLQHISICFNDYESDIVDAAASLINNSPDLKYLHLENCSLVEIDISNIIVALKTSSAIKYFCLINIFITEKSDDGIATVLESNHQLKRVKLVECKINENGLNKCIRSFNSTRLSHLILSKLNYLISDSTKQVQRPICNSLTHLTLSDVHLNATKLSYLSLPALTKLQHLNLSHNPLTDESADVLSLVIFNNNSLKHLDLCNCKLQSEGIKIIFNSLQAMNIAHLDMSINEVNIDVLYTKLMPTLSPNLKHLCLPYCELKKNEIDKISSFISNMVNLKYIDVGPNAVPISMVTKCTDTVFVSEGSKYIKLTTKGIKQVSLTNYKTENPYHCLHYLNVNDIDVTVDDEVGITVAALIANSPKLKHLEMAGGEWNSTNVIKCFSSLQNNHSMYLNFSNKFDCLNFTLTKIFDLLNSCTAITALDLHSCCRLKNVYMVIASPKFLNLYYLDLSNNCIDDGAADYLAALIVANVGLEYLNFCNCELSFSGSQNIYNALKVTSSLIHLDLCFNGVSDKSLDYDLVIALLTSNKHLKHMRIFNLALDDNKFHEIQSYLSVIEGLEQLIIKDCSFADKDVSRIISLINNNPMLHELTLLDCKMSSVKSKICFATALYLQCLNLDMITIKHSPDSSFHCNKSTFNLTDDDVKTVMTVDNNLGELIMFKLILNQKSLYVLSTNAVTIRYLKVLHIQGCTFTDGFAHYVASLIINNAATIQNFSLTSCRMTNTQKVLIVKSLHKLDITLLQYLNIRDNLCSGVANFKIIASLKHSCTKTNCRLNDNIVTAAMRNHKNLIISNLVINQNTLTELNVNLINGVSHLRTKNISITGVHFTEGDANNLATLINNNKLLQLFDISNCVMSDKAKNIIFDAIINLTSLKSLNLKNIVISDTLEDKVLVVIANNASLEYLEVTGCEINTAKLQKVTSSFNGLKVKGCL